MAQYCVDVGTQLSVLNFHRCFIHVLMYTLDCGVFYGEIKCS